MTIIYGKYGLKVHTIKMYALTKIFTNMFVSFLKIYLLYLATMHAGPDLDLQRAPWQTKLWGPRYHTNFNVYGSDHTEFRSK